MVLGRRGRWSRGLAARNPLHLALVTSRGQGGYRDRLTPLCGDACVVERAADPLHCARINSKSGCDLSNAFGSSWSPQSVKDTLLDFGGYPRSAKLFAFTTGPR